MFLPPAVTGFLCVLGCCVLRQVPQGGQGSEVRGCGWLCLWSACLAGGDRNGQLLLQNGTAKLYSQHDGIGPAWLLAAD